MVRYHWVLVKSREEFEKDVRKLGYSSGKDFVDKTGVTYRDIKGKKVEVINDRVFGEV